MTIGPRVVSWGENHMAVFFLDHEGEVNQRYWDGSQWSDDWVTFTSPEDYHFDTLAVSSWGRTGLMFGRQSGKAAFGTCTGTDRSGPSGSA